MARKRTELGAAAETAIALLTKQGKTAEEIAAVLRARGVKGVSARTIGRRMRELRGSVRAGRMRNGKKTSPRAKAPKVSVEPSALDAALDAELGDDDDGDVKLPSSPDAIPEGLSLDLLHRLRTKAERAANAALVAKELPTFAAMGRLVTSLSEAIRKATPPKEADPDENPDMRALADDVSKRFHKLIDQVAGTSEA